jgi:hypothetical protein
LCLILFEDTFTSLFKNKRQKEVKRYEKLRFFLIFRLVVGRIRRRTNNDGSGFGKPKTIRFRIHNTDYGKTDYRTYGSGSTKLVIVSQTAPPGARDLQSRPPELCSAPETCPPQDTRDWRRQAPQYCPLNLSMKPSIIIIIIKK